MLPSRRIRPLLAAAFTLGLALVVPGPGAAQQSIGSMRQGIAADGTREQQLNTGIAGADKVLNLLSRQLAVLSDRVASVQAQLDADQARLGRLDDGIAGESARLKELRYRLKNDSHWLADWLRSVYEDGQPDLVEVIFSSSGFSDLLERVDFLRRISEEVGAITARVHAERHASTVGLRVLRKLRARQAHATAQTMTVRRALQSIQGELSSRQAALDKARQLKLDELDTVRAQQADLKRNLTHALAVRAQQRAAARERALQAQIAALAAPPAVSSSPAGTSFTIPWSIVQCESGGQDLPPNYAGASGYYQIIPSTWSLYGGSGPAAYLAPKSEQDAVAARIWNGGAGASNWVCAALVGIA